MSKHEEKYCPKCKTTFECKVGSILLCQCSEVKLNSKEQNFINEQFDDCLCLDCIKQVKAEYHNQILQNKIKRILGIFYNNSNNK